MTLDETYERILLGIDREKHEDAILLFKCMAFSRRPLRVQELAEMLAFQFGTPIPRLNTSLRPKDAEKAVLSACSTLVSIIRPDGPSFSNNDNDVRVVQFSHYSIKEFLASERLAKSDKLDLSQFHISPEPAHTILAQTCISTLVQLRDSGDITDAFPLAKYAAQNWFHHAQCGVASQIQDGMACLFNPDEKHLALWVSMHNIDRVPSRSPHSELLDPPKPSPLYYATLCGFDYLVEHLIITRGQDPNKSYGGWGTPLHAAAVLGHTAIARFLLEHTADVNSRDKHNSTPLHEASGTGNLVVIQLLLSHGADVNALDLRGNSPLHRAFHSQKLDAIKLLFDRGANVNVRNKSNSTVLREASGSGNIDVVRLLLKLCDTVEVLDLQGDSPLHNASRCQKFDTMELLVNGGVDVNIRNKFNSTPLHEASAAGNLDVMRSLLSLGAAVDVRDLRGDSPLHNASRYRKFDAMKLLVNGGADPNVRNMSNSTPLHEASGSGNLDVIQSLLSCGADVNVLDHQGDSPLHKAYQYQKIDAMDLLVNRGADVNARNKSNSTLLHEASESGNLDIARLLLSHGAEVNALDHWGNSPLHNSFRCLTSDVVKPPNKDRVKVTHDTYDWTLIPEASSSGNVDLVPSVSKKCTGVMDTWDNGRSPLLYDALQEEKYAMVQLLLAHGADVNAREWGHRTPLQMALSEGSFNVSRLLIEHGADVDAQNDDAQNDDAQSDEDQTSYLMALTRGLRKLVRFLLNER